VLDKFWCSLCEGLIGPEYIEKLNDKDGVIERVANFVIDQLNSLPQQLKVALWVGLSAFKFYVFLITLKSLEELPTLKRKEIIESWAGGKAALTRKLFRPLRSLTVLAFFEQPEAVFLLDQ
jgi:hypothetical protein